MEHPDYIQWFKAAANALVKAKDLTQAALAALSGLSQPQIFRLLSVKGDAGSEKARRSMARALGTTYEDMLALGRRLESGQPAQAPLPLPDPEAGWARVKLPAWDQGELSKQERVALEKALAIMRCRNVFGGKPGQTLRQNISEQFDMVMSLAALLEGESGGIRRGPGGGPVEAADGAQTG